MGDSPIKAPKSQEPRSEELVFSIPVPEVNLFGRITRNYARQLRVLLTIPLIPQRRIRHLHVITVGDRVEVQILEYDSVRQIIPSQNNSENK
jgi:hypothetical protein